MLRGMPGVIVDPRGLRFYERSSGKVMKLVDDPASDWNGWLLYRHPDGQWVTLRKATDEDRTRLLAAEAEGMDRG